MPSQSPDSRFLAVRFAAQDATDFGMTDHAVRRFIELRDAGAGEAAIAEALRVPAEVVAELARADDAQALAHRIAEGEEPMYPAPAPEDRVVDARAGSALVPIVVLAIVLLGVIVYALVR